MMLSAESKRAPRQHAMWQKKWLAERNSCSAYHNILQELRVQDAENYRKYLRINVATFEFLLERLRPLITKQTTVMRAPISAEEQLAKTLHFLATGESYYSSMCQYLVADTTIGRIVPRVCWGIVVSLMKEYLPFPQTAEEWKIIAKGYEEKWNFPNCIGAIDGKHIAIVRPNNSVRVLQL